MKSRVRWDRDFDFDNAFWWLIVKLFLRGSFIPPPGYTLPALRNDPVPSLEDVERQELAREAARLKKEEEEERAIFGRLIFHVLEKTVAAAKRGEKPRLTSDEKYWSERLRFALAAEKQKAGERPAANQTDGFTEIFNEWAESRKEQREEREQSRKLSEQRRKDDEQ